MTPTLLALAVVLSAPGLKEAPKKDAASLVGEWAAERTIVDGTTKRLPAGTAWTFTADGKAALTVGGRRGPNDEGTFAADPKKDPAEVDITLGQRAPMKAIYRIDGDALTLCLAQDGQGRPTAFDAPAGSKAILMTLTRVKPKD